MTGLGERTVTGRIEIARPVEEVFDFVADERNEPRYSEEMLGCEKVTSGQVGVGTRYAAEMKAMGRVPVCSGSATACPRCPVLAPGRPGRVHVGRRALQRGAGRPVPGF
jgi:Polyketide cyclase / dehydrase and lipid transport